MLGDVSVGLLAHSYIFVVITTHSFPMVGVSAGISASSITAQSMQHKGLFPQQQQQQQQQREEEVAKRKMALRQQPLMQVKLHLKLQQ